MKNSRLESKAREFPDQVEALILDLIEQVDDREKEVEDLEEKNRTQDELIEALQVTIKEKDDEINLLITAAARQ